MQNANYLSQEQGLDVDVDSLYVKTAVANEGPRMKRIRPAPMGRAFRYQRRMSHIEIIWRKRAPSASRHLATTADSRRRHDAPAKTRQGQEGCRKKKAPAKKAAGEEDTFRRERS